MGEEGCIGTRGRKSEIREGWRGQRGHCHCHLETVHMYLCICIYVFVRAQIGQCHCHLETVHIHPKSTIQIMKKTLPEPINEQVEAHVRAILNQNEIVKSVKSEAQNVNAIMALKNIVN